MRYRAFISHASADREMAARLQRAIERFKVPKELRGRPIGDDTVPGRFSPLFRDRIDAQASDNLRTSLATKLVIARRVVADAVKIESLAPVPSPYDVAAQWHSARPL